MTRIEYDKDAIHLPDVNDGFPVVDADEYERAVRAQGTPCLIYKVGNGANLSESFNFAHTFEAHDAMAKARGLRRRGYWFAPFNIDQYLRVFPPADDADPILDFETNSTPLTVAAADAAMQKLHDEWGRWPDFYGGETWRAASNPRGGQPGTAVENGNYWGPNFNGFLEIPIGVGKPVLFQYSANGNGPAPHAFPGVKPNSDMNVLLVPYEELIGAPPAGRAPIGGPVTDEDANLLGFATLKDWRVHEMRAKAVADVLAGRPKRVGQDPAYEEQFDQTKARLGP
jgi:hypothetical protein